MNAKYTDFTVAKSQTGDIFLSTNIPEETVLQTFALCEFQLR